MKKIQLNLTQKEALQKQVTNAYVGVILAGITAVVAVGANALTEVREDVIEQVIEQSKSS